MSSLEGNVPEHRRVNTTNSLVDQDVLLRQQEAMLEEQALFKNTEMECNKGII